MVLFPHLFRRGKEPLPRSSVVDIQILTDRVKRIQSPRRRTHDPGLIRRTLRTPLHAARPVMMPAVGQLPQKETVLFAQL